MTTFVTTVTFNTIHDVSLVDSLAFIHIVTLLLFMAIHLVSASSSKAIGGIVARLSLIAVVPLTISFSVIVLMRISKFLG